MDNYISKAALEARRVRYKKGCRVELVSMEDPYAKLMPGEQGTVIAVDDIGSVHIKWDSGSNVAALHNEDVIKLVGGNADD